MSVLEYSSVPLPSQAERGIRLLTIHPSTSLTSEIHCSLKACDLDSRPGYEALSYTWGPPRPVFPIFINDKVSQARSNLYSALRRLRLPDRNRVMWIDAICIDQSNVPERNKTVKFMGDIYSSALGGVVAWFGEEGHDTHIVTPFLDRVIEGFNKSEAAEKKWTARFSRQRDLHVYGVPSLGDPGWRALYNLLLTPWSSRVWIVQEVVMAPRDPGIRILRGSHVFNMQQIALAMSAIYKWNLERELQFRYPARFATLWGEKVWQKHEPPLLDVVTRNWLTYASDGRDKIYGLVGLAHDVQLEIDYDEMNRVEDVFTDFARRVIEKHRNLAILGALSSTSTSRSILLPSWVPDWTVWNAHTFLLINPKPDAEGRGFMHFRAAGHCSTLFSIPLCTIAVHQPLVQGHIIDTIATLCGTGPVNRIMNSVHDVLEFFRQSEYTAQVQDEYTVISGKQQNYGHAKVEISAKKIYRYTGEPLLQAFYSALTMDDLHHRHQPQRLDAINRNHRLRKIYFHFHKLTHMLRESSLGLFIVPSPFLPEHNPVLLQAAMEHYVTAAMSVCVNRCLVRTAEKGYLGIFTERVREGDTVVLLEGARVPFVMRQSGRLDAVGAPTWEMVGDGYLHGIMNGEAWIHGPCEQFYLC